ncbi:MAG TPA: hypothetical protein VHE78_06235 [Gemmatimonadaceae bacterium]|nr:hypothetical protein [Gemmatimonadaceae bacterium]
MKRGMLLAAFSLATASAASTTATAQVAGALTTPVAKSDTVRTGVYQLSLEGMAGQLTIRRASGAVKASISAGAHAPAVRSWRREGSEYVLKADDGRAFSVTYRFRFSGDSVSGTFQTSSGMNGSIAGARRSLGS